MQLSLLIMGKQGYIMRPVQWRVVNDNGGFTKRNRKANSEI